jgi:hypothetical protein
MCSLVEVGAGSGFAWNERMRNVRDAIGFSSAVDFDSLGVLPTTALSCGELGLPPRERQVHVATTAGKHHKPAARDNGIS